MTAKKTGFCFALIGLLYCHIFGENTALQTGHEQYSASGFVSFWVLNEGDILPRPVNADIPLSFSIKKPQNPGYVEIESSTFSFVSPFEIRAKISFFYICEKTDSDCSKSYLSAQVKISGSAAGFCGAYFSKQDFFPFPVMFCSVQAGKGLAGITLHRKSYLETGKL